MQLRIANAPTSWGVEDPEDGANPPWRQMLDQVAIAGYAGVELGPMGYLPRQEHVLRRELEMRHLELVAGFLFEPLHQSVPGTLEIARHTCRLLGAVGASYLVIIQGFTSERERAAGRPGAALPLRAAEWGALVDAVHEVARIADDHGLVPCFHPHAGTDVEFAHEIERLAADTDVSLCIDTGHCAYAGVDPIGGDQTLPLYIFNHVRYGITPAVNAVASLFLLGTFCALTLAVALPTIVRRLRRPRLRRS